jgi:cytidyltransferase-like protein
MVSGCYDLMHAGHVAFFADASQHGNLYVSVGNDANVLSLKNHSTMFPEDERVYMVRAIRHVRWAAVCQGMGYQDWEADLDVVKPDIFFVNEDGDRPEKRELCAARGIKYVVAKREPAEGLEARSSTSIKAAMEASKK